MTHKEKLWNAVAPFVVEAKFRSISADDAPDAWEVVSPENCHRFKGGFVQTANGGHWFKYNVIPGQQPNLFIEINLTKPHVLI